MGDIDCLNEARTRFSDWIVNDGILSPDLKSLVYNYGNLFVIVNILWQFLKRLATNVSIANICQILNEEN